MGGRALRWVAAVITLLCVVGPAQAQENLDAGKSPSQLFSGTCAACHKSPRGLLKSVAPGSLPGFLRQHYTTSPEMAGVLSNYLISNGATDTRATGGRDHKDHAKEQAKGSKPEARQAAPEADGAPAEPSPTKRHGKRHGRAAPAAETPPDADGQAAPPATESKPEGKSKSGKHKRTRPAAEDPAKPATTREEAPAPRVEAPLSEPSRVEARPVTADAPPAAVASDPPRESDLPASLRADPAPAAAPEPATTQSIASPSTGSDDPAIPTSPQR